MSNYINHITLSTGHCRRSPRSEVSDATLDILRPWLLDLVESAGKSPLPVAELSHFSALAIVEVGLVVTIYGPSGPYISGRPNKTDGAPIVTIGVAQRTRQGSELWSKLSKHFVTVAGLEPPSTPWCAVALHENIMAFPDAAEWLGDLERCIAWAWVTRHAAISTAACNKCGYPVGDDWLDGGDTCPRCKLVQ